MKYRLREGKKHYGVKPGELVELRPEQVDYLSDRFEPAELQVSDEPTGHIVVDATSRESVQEGIREYARKIRQADDVFDPSPFNYASSWYEFPDGKKLQGEDNARAYLIDQGAEQAREWRG